MNPLGSTDSPQQRLSFLLKMGLVTALSIGIWWVWKEYFEVPPVPKRLELPYRASAEVVGVFGPFDGDGYHLVTVTRGQARSAAMKFLAADWPIACRFYAEAAAPDSLAIIQLSPKVLQQDAGHWLDAQTLAEIPLANLPDALKLLDDRVVE
jgi:hypothetical protein